MINTDEDSLICDFAETYHIYDYKSLPLIKAGIFACGLRENSRIVMKMANVSLSLENMLLAAIVDGVNLIAWLRSKNSVNGENRPKSVLEVLSGLNTSGDNEIISFKSGEDFDKEWKRITGVSHNGN